MAKTTQRLDTHQWTRKAAREVVQAARELVVQAARELAADPGDPTAVRRMARACSCYADRMAESGAHHGCLDWDWDDDTGEVRVHLYSAVTGTGDGPERIQHLGYVTAD